MIRFFLDHSRKSIKVSAFKVVISNVVSNPHKIAILKYFIIPFLKNSIIKIINISRILLVSVVPIVIHDRDHHDHHDHGHHHIIDRPIFLHPCDRHERWYKCLPTCGITCKNLHNATCLEPQHPCRQGCECKSGYARLYPSSKCRPVDHCPRK